MSILFLGGNAGGGSGYPIDYSARFNGTSAYLGRTQVAGNTSTWTLSMWVKRAKLSDAYMNLFHCSVAGADNFCVRFAKNGFGEDNIEIYSQFDNEFQWVSSALFRDTSAWGHLVLATDVTQGTAANRIKVYWNGSELTGVAGAVFSGPYPGSTTAMKVNAAGSVVQFGKNHLARYFSGYMSDCYLIDGQALTPSSFGEFDANGVWSPISYTGAYGTNGFKLEFQNSGALGTDTSGNGNNFTVNGLTAADQMLDTPTNNYATWNPLLSPSSTLSSGNTASQETLGSGQWTTATFGVSSGKWYWEVAFTSGTYFGSIGIQATGVYGFLTAAYGIDDATNTTYINGASDSSTYPHANYTTYTAGTVFAFAFDAGAGTLAVYANNSLLFTMTGIVAGTYTPWLSTGRNSTIVRTANFGATAFAYTPPTDYLPLCTANLPAVAISDPSQHFNTVLDTGANIKTTSEGLYSNFLEWIKDRANSNNHQLIDTVRGTSAVLQSNNTNAETTYSAPAGTSVGWVWNSSNAAVVNNAGSITSNVSANTTAGFSIVTYTGTGANGSIGHGLNATPKMIIVKQRDVGTTENWAVWHTGIANTEYMLMNLANTKATGATYWNSSSPSSTTFSVGSANDTNESGKTFVAYCFAEIPGYSKFGSYAGNNSATDGAFCYCGFRPAYVLTKGSDGITGWHVQDAKRGSYNLADASLTLNTTATEVTGLGFDLLSNGFKVRSTPGEVNSTGVNYIFVAFAEHPFGGNNVAPATAR